MGDSTVRGDGSASPSSDVRQGTASHDTTSGLSPEAAIWKAKFLSAQGGYTPEIVEGAAELVHKAITIALTTEQPIEDVLTYLLMTMERLTISGARPTESVESMLLRFAGLVREEQRCVNEYGPEFCSETWWNYLRSKRDPKTTYKEARKYLGEFQSKGWIRYTEMLNWAFTSELPEPGAEIDVLA